eukprot:2970735-Alexandrium_andersonii.AAC.1
MWRWPPSPPATGAAGSGTSPSSSEATRTWCPESARNYPKVLRAMSDSIDTGRHSIGRQLLDDRPLP